MRALLLAGVVALAWYGSASASVISIGVQQGGLNGGAIVTVATDAADPGSAHYSGTYGTFNLTSINVLGAPQREQGNLGSSLVASTTQGGVISVYITESGLTAPQGASTFTSLFNSIQLLGAAYRLDETTYYSPSNALYGGIELSEFTSFGTGTSSSSATSTIERTYSETIRYTLTANGGNSYFNDSVTLSAVGSATDVPEPASLALLGLGAVCIVAARRRRTA